MISLQDPLVVVLGDDFKQYVQGKRTKNSVTEKDVERFVMEFLPQMFVWDELLPEKILRQISPFVTEGLLARFKLELTKRSEKDLKGKKLSQSIANAKILVTEKNVIANFDKVLRIDGIPLVVPSEISFNIIRGSQTRWNPVGLYVNGLIEHEGKNN